MMMNAALRITVAEVLLPKKHSLHAFFPLARLLQLVVASPPKANSQAEKLGVKKGDVISSINGLNAEKMDSFEVTDYLAMYQVCTDDPLRWES